MKTVIDAVNEFGCKFPYADSHYIIHWKGVENNTSFGFDFMPSNMKTNSNWYSVCTYEEFNQCVDEMSKAEWIKPVTPLTYTQAMADAGTLPSVGMEYKDGVVMVDADADGMYVVQEAGVSIICALSGITPVTPPIVLEDGKAYQFDYKQGVKVVNSMTGICILSGDIFLTVDGSFCIPNCTNIKLLGVTS